MIRCTRDVKLERFMLVCVAVVQVCDSSLTITDAQWWRIGLMC